MINKLRLILFLAFLWNNSHAQQKSEIDSLKYALSNAKHDTTRVMIMTFLCAEYRYSYQDSALSYGEKAYALATKIKFIKGAIYALSFQSFAVLNSGDLPKALQISFEAAQLGKEYRLEGQTTPALNTIGNIYLLLGDYSRALRYFRMQKAVGVKLPEGTGYGFSFLSIADVLIEMHQLDSVQYNLKMANEILAKANVKTAQVLARYGDLETVQGNYALALDYYQKGLEINEPRTTANIQNALSKLYKKINQPDSAIAHAKKGLAVAELYSLKRTILESTKLLSELYEPIDAEESLRYYKLSMDTKEGLIGAGNMQAIQTMINQEEERQKEIEAAKMAYQTRLKQYGFFAGITMLLIISFILFRNNKLKQRANALLHKQKEEIQNTLTQLKATQTQLIQSEKMASLGELTAGIAHEIQNPLNFVNNFSEVNMELLSEMGEEIDKGNFGEVKSIAKDVIDNEEKINHHGKRADAIVKGMLQHSRTSSGTKEPTDINALCDEYLRLSYHGLRAKDKSFNAKFEKDFDSTIEKINVIPQDIGRVILNLINNAFYAVTEKRNGNLDGFEPTVSVSTKQRDDKVEITVKDNGNGISQKVLDKIFQPFFTTKPTGQGTGLGLSLSYDIVKAHGGDLKVETREGEGSMFIIHLAIN